MFEVVFYSMCGNTKKVAEAIAVELGVKAENIKTKKELAQESFVFLGSGCYGYKPGRRVLQFIAKNNLREDRWRYSGLPEAVRARKCRQWKSCSSQRAH